MTIVLVVIIVVDFSRLFSILRQVLCMPTDLLPLVARTCSDMKPVITLMIVMVSTMLVLIGRGLTSSPMVLTVMKVLILTSSRVPKVVVTILRCTYLNASWQPGGCRVVAVVISVKVMLNTLAKIRLVLVSSVSELAISVLISLTRNIVVVTVSVTVSCVWRPLLVAMMLRLRFTVLSAMYSCGHAFYVQFWTAMYGATGVFYVLKGFYGLAGRLQR